MANYMHYDAAFQPRALRTQGVYCLTFIIEGEGKYESSRVPPRNVMAGDMIISCPEVPIRYSPPKGKSWFELYTSFSGPLFDVMAANGVLNPTNPISHVEPILEWKTRFEEALPPPTPVDQAAHAGNILRFAAFLADVCSLGTQDATADIETSGWVVAAKSWLVHDLSRSGSLPTVAERLGMSYESFRKRFAREASMSPAQYRFKRKMETACEMLLATDMPGKEIADTLGFSSESIFSRRFKQAIGISARAYRAHSRLTRPSAS